MAVPKTVDSKGRLMLGGSHANATYLIEERENGEVLLTPAMTIPIKEKWLFDNKKALGMVERGLADAKAGRVKSRGSFAKFADDGDDT
jgi:hypothetical protein